MRVVRTAARSAELSLQVRNGDWEALHTLSLWLFHTPTGAVPNLPAGTPAIALRG